MEIAFLGIRRSVHGSKDGAVASVSAEMHGVNHFVLPRCSEPRIRKRHPTRR